MKTKDFIKMLEKADPTGEGYVRLPSGGAPWFAEAKEGYWDGAYQYLELGAEKKYYPHDSVLVTSKKGYKIDVHVMETNTIIWDENGDMDKIRKRIRFDYEGQRADEAWLYIEKEAAAVRDHHTKSLADWTMRTYDSYFEGGFEVRQPKTSKIGTYNSIVAHPTGFLGNFKEKKQLCQGECMAIIESGKFVYEEQDEYYVWKYDVENGKNWSLR